jgi:hypothetical protein
VKKPNIIYLHSHDTGRYIQPYGHNVPTPNMQRTDDPLLDGPIAPPSGAKINPSDSLSPREEPKVIP